MSKGIYAHAVIPRGYRAAGAIARLVIRKWGRTGLELYGVGGSIRHKGIDGAGSRPSTHSMDTNVRPPRSGNTTGQLLVEPGDRARVFLRARQAASKAASLRELGDEYAALSAEMNSQAWLRKFAVLNEQLPGGSANQDFTGAQ